MASNKTQGLSLFFVKSPTAIQKAPKVVGVSNFGGTRSQIDETDTDDTEEMRFTAGLKNPGSITCDLNQDFANDAQKDLEALYDSGAEVTWILGLSDGTAPPTIAAGNITLPTTRTFIKFTGYIADFPLSWAKNDIGRSTMQIQRSGVRTVSRKVVTP
jgi:hypothetical protein